MNAFRKLVVLGTLVNGIGIPIAIGDEPMATPAQIESSKQSLTNADRLKQFEAVMDRYYRGDSLKKARTGLDESIDQYNRWTQMSLARHESARVALDKEFASLSAIGKQSENIEKQLATKPDPHDEVAVESYNALVDRRNDIVRSYNRAGGAYKQREIAFNDSVKQSQRDIQTRCKELDAQKTAVQDQLAVYKRWVESRSDAAFFKEVNGFYAHLYKEVVAGKTPELVTMIDRVAAIRHELGLQAITDQAEAGGGLVIVEATLCRQEKCFLIVDTGATTVTISRALVDVLGLSHRLGKPVQATLADGTRTAARELLVPHLSVHGMEAKDVKAIVLDEPEAGVDGLLGLSYLAHFDFHIDQRHSDTLILKPKPGE